MTITSKFPSKCKKCSGHIKPGEKIEWSKETGPVHLSCPATGNPRISPDPRRSAPPIVPGRPGPYAGQFKRVEQLFHEAEQRVAHDAWLAGAANHLQALSPIDALRDVMVLLQLSQQRVDAGLRKKEAAPCAR